MINDYKTEGVYVGYANKNKGKLINKDTLFPTASLQKAITAVAIVLLVNEHKINQYTRLSKFFPKVRNAADITIRQLLTHMSGLKAPEKTPDKILSEKEAVKWAINNTEAVNRPGTKFNYTNVNYTLLAGIISELSDDSYESFIKKQVFDKAEVLNTYFWDDLSSKQVVASSYIYETKDYEYENRLDKELASSLVGAGNIYSTTSDYYKIQRSIRNGTILNVDDYHYMVETLPNAKNNYGGGMYHEEIAGINYKYAFGYLHGNGTKTQHANFANEMYMSAGNKNGVIMFTNQSPNELSGSDFKKIAMNIFESRGQ